MKRRRKTVTNRDTKVQLATVCMPNNTEKKSVIIDHLRNIGFVEDDANGDIHLSVGVFNSTPTKYSSIKKLIARNFSVGDSDIINKAIIGVSMKSTEKPDVTKVKKDTAKPTEEDTTVSMEEDTAEATDLEKETSCYNYAAAVAKRLSNNINALLDAGVSKEYILSRYPNIEERLTNIDNLLAMRRMELYAATKKKEKLLRLLKEAEYEEYLYTEALICTLRSCTESIDFDESIKSMLEEDFDELNRLNRIKELEEELAALKSKSKFPVTPASTQSTPAPVVELEVELPTEKQDKEIRFLANHLYQVRRGNEDHNPTICRRIAELSAELKLTKSEFCKKILSVSVQCWNERHRKAFTDLGLHLYGERRHPTDTDNKKDYKDEIRRWASIHIIADDGNDVLNTDVYDAFIKDTSSDVAKISFYNILARSLGYKPKCKYRSENGKTHCDTYYAGYRLV